MITYFSIGETKIYSKSFKIIPSLGVGNIEFIPCDSIWTGDCHIYRSNIKLLININSIEKVSTRSSMDEDNEEWKVLFEREKREFSYEYERKLENLLVKISKKS
jgi:hypothetical protein